MYKIEILIMQFAILLLIFNDQSKAFAEYKFIGLDSKSSCPSVPPVSDLILCDICTCLTDEYLPLLDSEKLTGFIVFNPGLL